MVYSNHSNDFIASITNIQRNYKHIILYRFSEMITIFNSEIQKIQGGEEVYEKFERLMKEKGVTAYQVSKATGIPSSTFSEWKYGKYTPKVDKLMKVAEYFEVPLEHFIKAS